MINQIQAANTNTEETLEDVLADYRLTESEREAIQNAAQEVLSNLPQSQIAEFLQDLRSRIEEAREPSVYSHTQDIAAATKALARKALTGGKGRLDYFSYNFPPGSVKSVIDNLAA
jgi:hypothetical protein